LTPDLVIFDCDGVLVDSEGISNRLLQENLARHGLQMSLEDLAREFVGGTIRDVARRAAERGARLPQDWVEDFYEEMYALLALGTPLIEGIEDVLDRLDAAGIPYAVGSNGSDRKMQTTLGQHPAMWARLKDRLFSAHTHGIAKPEPGLFLLAAARFGVAPGRAAVVDDSPTGCLAAARAGIPAFGYAEHDDGARMAALGATVFHRMAELPALLGL
jgi:HAD superfamily hydrolase (TIGR01509 family)